LVLRSVQRRLSALRQFQTIAAPTRLVGRGSVFFQDLEPSGFA